MAATKVPQVRVVKLVDENLSYTNSPFLEGASALRTFSDYRLSKVSNGDAGSSGGASNGTRKKSKRSSQSDQI